MDLSIPHHEYARLAGELIELAINEANDKVLDYAASDDDPAMDDYPGAHANVLCQLQEAARETGLGFWDAWNMGMIRHQMPVKRVIRALKHGEPAQEQREILRQRLQDQLGYVLIALATLKKLAA